MIEELFRAIYVSTATRDLRDEELVPLLEVSRRNNAAQDITGMLGYHDHSFIQVLEGPQGPIEALLGSPLTKCRRVSGNTKYCVM